MINIDSLKFNNDGLIPAIIIDYISKEVLMLGYMSRESLIISLEKQLTCFWSRSRKSLWLKGETSGNYQHIKLIKTDCDNDTLLIYVKADGPACHTGNVSCFYDNLFCDDDYNDFSISNLIDLLKDRKNNPKEGSYTNYLFEKGIDKILKKVGEESTEVIIAGKSGDKRDTVYEIADLIYHILVLMTEMDIKYEDIIKELSSRHIIDKKVKQEKMT